MKRLIVIGALTALIVSGGMLGANMGGAQTLANTPGEAGPEGGDRLLHVRLSRLADALDLTSAQRDQIRALWGSERASVAQLRQELAANREELRSLVKAETFDEAAVRTVAEELGKVRAELIALTAHLRSQVYALLTPEQKERAEKLHLLRAKGHPRQRS